MSASVTQLSETVEKYLATLPQAMANAVRRDLENAPPFTFEQRDYVAAMFAGGRA